MLRAMPSPKNTNFARLFIDRPCTGAAYDEKLPDAAAAALCEFLRDKLAPEDYAKFCELAGMPQWMMRVDRSHSRACRNPAAASLARIPYRECSSERERTRQGLR